VEDDQVEEGEARGMRRGGREEQKKRRRRSRRLTQVREVDVREVAMQRMMM
jgi:hypothetical protein